MADLSSTAIDELRRNARSMIRELGLLNDAYFEIGVTLAERHLLIELANLPSPTMGEIGERLLLDKSTISRLISKAIKKGYIDCFSDEKDKRKRFLKITDFGKKTLQAFEPIAFNQTKQALLSLSHEEIETVYKGVSLYAKGLRRSRTKEQFHSEAFSIENLPEIKSHLHRLGLSLCLFQNEDEEELYQIFREIVDSGTYLSCECSSIDEFRHFFTGQVYVCRTLTGKVVGGFFLKPNYSGRSRHIANAAYMMHKAYRNKGIGNLLIKASLQLAKDLGFHAMQFNMVLSQNKAAIKLYQKLGFTIIGTLPEAIRNSDDSFQDVHIMYRKL